MRVAVIAEVFLPKIDGVVHRTVNLIRQLRAAGDEVLVVCPWADGCRACPVPVVDFPSFAFPLYPEYRIGLPDTRLVAAVEEFAPDVLHFVNPFAFGFRCYDVLRRAAVQVPTVFSFHTLYGEFVRQYRLLRPLSRVLWWLMREYHNRADVNLTVSRLMQDELTRRGFQRVHHWPPAVDSDLFRPGAATPHMRARLAGRHGGRPLLLTVSRLAPEKNVGFLADVLRELPDACLAIVGDGPARGDLEHRFARLNAHFLGYLTGPDLAAAYASADAFVYASETETMGNVVLEAMASGLPVVTPRAGGIPNLIAHGRTGFLYTPGDRAEAVRHVHAALADSAPGSALGQAARAWVEDRGWGRSVAEVRRIYCDTIAQYRPSFSPSSRARPLARALVFGLVSGFRSLAKDRTSADAFRGRLDIGSVRQVAPKELVGSGPLGGN
jgi:glycosyltransferase involved in cell wall biosynthesis